MNDQLMDDHHEQDDGMRFSANINEERDDLSSTEPSSSTPNEMDKEGGDKAIDGEEHFGEKQRTYTGLTPSDFALLEGSVVLSEAKRKALLNAKAPRKVCFIALKEGVSVLNLMTIPLVPTVTMMLQTYTNVQVIFLLRDPDYHNVSDDDIGKVSSSLVFWSLPMAIVGTFATGYVFDIMGRRLTLFLSFMVCAILTAIVPQMPTVYPGLLIIRILIQLSFCAPMTNPLLADYVHKESLGKAASFIGLGYIIGEVLTMGVLFNITANMSFEMSFLLVAVLGAGFSVGFLFMVTEPQLRKNNQNVLADQSWPIQEEQPAPEIGKSFEPVTDADGNELEFASKEAEMEYHMRFNRDRAQSLASGEYDEDEFDKLPLRKKITKLTSQLWAACRANNALPIAFLGSSITKLYAILFSTFWLLFITTFEGEEGSSITDDREAQKVYSNVMIISIILGATIVPFVGKLVDTYTPQVMLPLAFFIRGVSLLAFMFIKDPAGGYAYTVSILMVVGTACENVTIDTYLFRNTETQIRGIVLGTAVAFGFIGQLLFTLVGGFLFDDVGRYSPFELVGFLDFCFMIFLLTLVFFGKLRNDIKDRELKKKLENQ